MFWLTYHGISYLSFSGNMTDRTEVPSQVDGALVQDHNNDQSQVQEPVAVTDSEPSQVHDPPVIADPDSSQVHEEVKIIKGRNGFGFKFGKHCIYLIRHSPP